MNDSERLTVELVCGYSTKSDASFAAAAAAAAAASFIIPVAVDSGGWCVERDASAGEDVNPLALAAPPDAGAPPNAIEEDEDTEDEEDMLSFWGDIRGGSGTQGGLLILMHKNHMLSLGTLYEIFIEIL